MRFPEIEYQPLDIIKRFQEEKLRENLDYLNSSSPFYRKMFEYNHIDVSKIRTIEDLQNIPFTDKKDLQQHNRDFICVPKDKIIDYITTSGTTGDGPSTIMEASMQVDLCHHDYPDLWQKGIWMDEFPKELRELHDELAPVSEEIIDALYEGLVDEKPEKYEKMYADIVAATERKNAWLCERIAYWKAQGKTVGLLGGDHSTPLAYHQYLNKQGVEYGILHADAHMDLRDTFEGFKYSHASIFYNTLKFNKVKKLVQVGIRDYCHQEKALAESQPERVKVFFDRDNRRRMYEGATWKTIVDEMVAALPQKTYISIDIDALDPKLCPNTGTPVPGGLEYEELMYLLNRIREAGKEIIGFDLCEVSPGDGDWDGNVGARVLFHLCGVAAK